jgi:ADP-ribosylglycohydrolase
MTSRNDRVEGVLLATAAGDALGAPYEFQPARGPELEVAMVGGGVWEPGEWTDDTSMAIAIAEEAAKGADLLDTAAQDAIVARWHRWMRDAKDVGIQTRSVLTAAGRDGISAARARAEAAKLHQRTGRTAGNGSLMRTAAVALAYLDDGDEDALVAAARALSELTHFDPEAGDACVLWCCAIRHAVRTAELDVRIGLRHIESGRRDLWSKRLDEAESSRPADFANNGWVVAALQAAWSAIATTLPASMPQCVRATTPTPSLRSPAACSAPPTGPPRSRCSGAVCCTAGRASTRTGWSHLPVPSNAREDRTRSTSPTPGRRSTRSPATPTTRTCGSAASARCGGCPRVWTRSSRCAGWPMRTSTRTSRTSRCV